MSRRRRDWGPFMPVKLKSSNAGPTMDASSSSASPPLLPAQKTRRKPSPDELYPDWTWLAAARVITEGKMREEMSRSNVDANIDGLCSWENLREGAWVGKRVEECRDDELNGKLEKWEPSTKTARGDGLTNGWDWAGAEGTWRRCVCWLDYEDLSFYNDINEFDDPTLQEAILIVPLRLRVVGFSEPAVARYADRPTIHVEGEMGGAWWEEQDDGMEGDVRKVHGTVSVIADGSVRWCLYSSDEESDDDQWVSEGIQIGGVGSAIGVLGMWTGARHEEGDPLGAFWSWKVA
ncbi:hypothetical protein A0H81_07263 [Grifola frondosa]|uniref:Uncharacterized protein n=1 Tax=Grifola frondosa TaxID=5627 RepID=A0A1C7M809_GRIFR|nr:hypothetical protein A0H81_07263 [Grifola frondosa]